MSYVAAVKWEAKVVASLRRSKRDGYSFTAAWKLAMQEVAVPRTSHNTEPAKLFVLADDDPEEIGVVEAMRGYCLDAWLGKRPALAYFDLESLRESEGGSSAASVGVVRQAAA